MNTVDLMRPAMLAVLAFVCVFVVASEFMLKEKSNLGYLTCVDKAGRITTVDFKECHPSRNLIEVSLKGF